MIFPSVLGSTAHPASAAAGTAAAVILAFCKGNLIQVAMLACATVFAVDLAFF